MHSNFTFNKPSDLVNQRHPIYARAPIEKIKKVDTKIFSSETDKVMALIKKVMYAEGDS
jgi:hypothetical protein